MPRMTVVWKINLLVLGGLLLVLGAAVTLGLVQTSELSESQVRMALRGAGVAASLVLSTDDLAALAPADVDTDAYRTTEAHLKQLAEVFGLSDLYILRPTSGTKGWEFLYDTADGPFDEQGGAEGGFSAYQSPPEELVQAWSARETVITAEPYTDEFGTFRSSFLSLVDSAGTAHAIVGADHDLAQLIAARNSILEVSAVLVLIGLGLIGGLAFVLVRMIDVPLNLVTRRFSALAAGTADLTEHVPVRSRDELGELAEGFNQFVDKLGVLVGDLRAGVTETARIQLLLQRDSEETSTTLANTRQSLLSLTASSGVLDSSIQEVTGSLESMVKQGSTLDALARDQETTTNRAARDHEVLDQEAQELRAQAHAVGKALADLDRESLETTRRIDAELAVLRQLSGAVASVHGIVSTLLNTADATGLLAMNASIEAAHAGLQGRGFAVIAQRMRQQAETARADADRIGTTLGRMVDLIGEASASAQATSGGAAATHARIETAKDLVSKLTVSGDHLEAYSQRSRQVLDELRASSRGVAEASGAVAQGTHAISASTRSLQDASAAVLGGAETILEGADHLAAVVEDIRDVANRLTTVSQSLEENLVRLKTS